ncbi:MAG: hypothetical protein KDI63_15520 [Gammaproteobacteria bacterium]|nr:hypothetical protein [Gammaproteobacteria bacterium]
MNDTWQVPNALLVRYFADQGLFSELDFESMKETNAELVDELFTDPLPVGSLERSLVEKIAGSLWRQRRLVTSPSSTCRSALFDSRSIRAAN